MAGDTHHSGRNCLCRLSWFFSTVPATQDPVCFHYSKSKHFSGSCCTMSGMHPFQGPDRDYLRQYQLFSDRSSQTRLKTYISISCMIPPASALGKNLSGPEKPYLGEFQRIKASEETTSLETDDDINTWKENVKQKYGITEFKEEQ